MRWMRVEAEHLNVNVCVKRASFNMRPAAEQAREPLARTVTS